MSLAVCLVAAIAAPLPPVAPPPRPLLTTVREIRALSPAEAAKRHAIALTGVVTYANARPSDFFVQDATAGVYVAATPLAAGLAAGDRVEVFGVTDPGDFAPCVRATAVRKLGTAPLPDPYPYNLVPEDARWLDAQYVQVWGVVQHVATLRGITLVQIGSMSGTAFVAVPGEGHAAHFRGLLQAAVRVRAVCVPAFDEHKFVNQPARLFAAGPDALVVLKPADADPADRPPIPLGDLRRFSPEPHPGGRRVKVLGTATGAWDTLLFIQDDAGNAVTAVPDAPFAFPPGTAVEVIGTLGFRGRWVMLDAARVRATADPPVEVTPRATTAGEAQDRELTGVLATVAGRVEEIRDRDGAIDLVVRDGRFGFDVLFPPGVAAPWPPVGAKIDVTGVVFPELPGGKKAAGFVMFARRPTDLVVREWPPPSPAPPVAGWFTPARVGTAAAAAAGLGAILLVWAVTLRRQVRKQTADVRAAFDRETHLQEQLRQAQKLEAVGRLAGGIAHDFNNLLTVINGCSELLVDQVPADGVARELVADVRRAGERAAALTGQLLMFSRRRTVTPAAVDLAQAAADAVRLLSRVIPETITVAADYAPDLTPVRAEVGLVHQIILNLALNARDAMSAGGTLTVSVRPRPDAAGARLVVADTGCGMNEATRARVFEPFFTTKEVGQGTGLGLATVYGIVQAVGAHIRFATALGTGTTFEIDFAAAGASTIDRLPAVAPDSKSFGLMAARRGVVLLVEDDEGVRLLVRRVLEGEGYHVLTAAAPAEAVRVAREHLGVIHLLLSDVVMPGMNGRALAEQIAPLRPSIRVLYMSGYAADDAIRQGVLAEEVALLAKPFTAAELAARVADVLGRPAAGKA